MSPSLIPSFDRHKAVELFSGRPWVRDVLIDTEGVDPSEVGLDLYGIIGHTETVPGDAALIQKIEWSKNRWSAKWAATEAADRDEVVGALTYWPSYSTFDLTETFGPNWKSAVEIVRRAAALTVDEAKSLALHYRLADTTRDSEPTSDIEETTSYLHSAVARSAAAASVKLSVKDGLTRLDLELARIAAGDAAAAAVADPDASTTTSDTERFLSLWPWECVIVTSSPVAVPALTVVEPALDDSGIFIPGDLPPVPETIEAVNFGGPDLTVVNDREVSAASPETKVDPPLVKQVCDTAPPSLDFLRSR